MIHFIEAQDAILGFLDLGGPVVALLLALSVLAGAIVLWKLWQFRAAGVGRHAALHRAVAERDAGSSTRAVALAEAAPSHLGPVLAAALAAAGPAARERLHAMAEARVARLETGLRLLDTIAQLAPLLGLFGTVIGMIDAFRAMQAAGQAVDPSVLAGGIWVALLTTAAGLAVAMPASVLLAWLDGRVAAERRTAEEVIEAALCPGQVVRAGAPSAAARRAEGTGHAPA